MTCGGHKMAVGTSAMVSSRVLNTTEKQEKYLNLRASISTPLFQLPYVAIRRIKYCLLQNINSN